MKISNVCFNACIVLNSIIYVFDANSALRIFLFLFLYIIKMQEDTFFFDAILLHRNVKIKTDALRYIISVFFTH